MDRGAGRGSLRERYRIAAERRAAFLALVRDMSMDLEAMYASSRSDAEKRAAKAERIGRLRARYAELREQWTSGPTYDAWFERGVNNAAIALVSTYDRWVPALEALLARSGGDLETFYRASDALAALPPAERRSRLEELERTARRSLPTMSLPSPIGPLLAKSRATTKAPSPIERKPGSLDCKHPEWPLSPTV